MVKLQNPRLILSGDAADLTGHSFFQFTEPLAEVLFALLNVGASLLLMLLIPLSMIPLLIFAPFDRILDRQFAPRLNRLRDAGFERLGGDEGA